MQADQSRITTTRPTGTIRELLSFLLPVAIGLAIAFVLLREVAIPRLGLSQTQRIKELITRLDNGLGDKPTLVFLGNSVTVEGVDASIVQEIGRAHV